MHKRTLKIIGLSLILVFGAYRTWNDDGFQMRFFPQRYWASEVERLESREAFLEGLVRWNAIELAKSRMTLEADVAQFSVLVSDPRARQAYVQSKIDKMHQTAEFVKLLEADLAKVREELASARRELSRAQGR